MLIVRGCAWVLAGLLAAVLTLAVIDYTLRFPSGIRLIALAALGYLGWRLTKQLVIPALRAHFSPVDLALRIEQHDQSARGLLASAVELHSSPPDDPIGEALTQATIARAETRTGQPKPIVRTDHTLRSLAVLLAVLAVAFVPVVTAPKLAAIGAQRTLAPWSGASWPKRYTITDSTRSAPHAIDESLPIRIAVSPSTSDARASVHWRVLDARNNALTPTTRSLLAAQPINPTLDGRIYEHLLDTRSIAERSEDAELVLEYRLQTRDDSTRTKRIPLARPPELVETRILVSRPPYALGIDSAAKLAPDESTQTEDQFVVQPVLGGSRITLRWVFTKPIDQSQISPPWAHAIGVPVEGLVVSYPQENSVELTMTATDPLFIEPIVRDRLGIAVRSALSADIPVHTDAPPAAAMTLPDRDIMVTTHAVFAINAEMTDDIALHETWISATHARIPSDSPGAVPEPSEPTMLVRVDARTTHRQSLETTLRVADFDPTPGDEIWIHAHALDALGASMDAPGIESEPRVLRVVDDLTMIEQLQSSIAPVRAALQRLDEQQAALQDRLQAAKPETARDQRALSEQIRSQQRVIAQINQIAERNTIDDPALRSLLEDAESILSDADHAADRAADAIDQARKSTAQREQQTVRDRLGELLAMLDRGQDGWLARRSVQQLRDEIERLNTETTQLGATTAGKSLAQLSADERTTLEKILDRQRSAAEQARAMLDELDERAEQLQDADPTQAEALRRAAAQGRGAQIQQTLDQAGDELGGNKTGAASQSQQAAIDELDSMLDEIDHAAKNRDSALRRQLATIIEQLKSLIAAQNEQLARVHSGAADLDDAMIGLIQNTLAVRDTATGAFPETQTIASRINSAADAQSLAITAFRASPPDPLAAEQQERNALEHLEQALADAERLEEQAADREARRLRNELKAKYRDALETQVIIRDATTPLLGVKLSRKQRSELRTLARTQEEIRALLDALIAETEGLSDAPVFTLAHAQIDRALARAVSSMSERTPPRSIAADHATAVHLLSALVEVLDDPPPKEQEFEDGSSGGGSGSGSGGQEEPLIPPVAQIKLLRSIQQLAAMQTRALSESDNAPDPDAVRALGELQQSIAVQGQELMRQLSEQQPNTDPLEVQPPEGDSE